MAQRIHLELALPGELTVQCLEEVVDGKSEDEEPEVQSEEAAP